jgi:hypothetical protein
MERGYTPGGVSGRIFNIVFFHIKYITTKYLVHDATAMFTLAQRRVNTEVESEQQNRTAHGGLARVLQLYSCRKAQIKDIDCNSVFK